MRGLPETPDRRTPSLWPGLRRFLFAGATLWLPLWGCTVRELPEEEAGRSTGVEESVAGAEIVTGADSAAIAEAVLGMLRSSTAAWNAGDLDGFVDDYWPSEGLTFSGSGGVTRGWEDVRGRYERTYWAPGAQRDSLRFEELEVMPLGLAHALTLGKYVLYRPEEGDRVTSTGFFSLVLRKVEGEWKIIHDHTSAAPPS